MFQSKYLGQSSSDKLDGYVSCKTPGNPKCNPETWNDFIHGNGSRGYRNSCCSDQEKCGVGEGDCNSDSECHGSLVCEYNGCSPTTTDTTLGFSKHASCCQQPSGTYILSMKFIMLIFYG